jgi:hypothetical protein
MIDQPSHIFRPDAVRRYAQRREHAVLPPLAAPSVVRSLWLLLSLLMAGMLALWCARIPVYMSGPAVMIDRPAGRHADNAVVVLAFLPVARSSHPRAGQRLFLTLSPAGMRIERTVLAVEPGVYSPAAAARRFALPPRLALAIPGPSVVVLASLTPVPAGVAVQEYVGGVYRADLEAGSERALSLLPLLGRIMGAA